MHELVFALDANTAGQQQWLVLARQAGLSAAAYGGYKDVNETWAAASGEEDAVPEALREAWEERAAIIAMDGHLTHTEAERLAWTGLQPAREEH